MKTFRYLLFGLVATLAITSCGGGGDDAPDTPIPTPTPTPTPTPETKGNFYSLTCSMPAEASEKTVTLTGLSTAISRQVQAAGKDWLTVTQVPYTSGTPQVKVACTQNLQTSQRAMDVVFIAASDTLLLTVRQAVFTGGGTDVTDPNDTPSDQPAFSRGCSAE